MKSYAPPPREVAADQGVDRKHRGAATARALKRFVGGEDLGAASHGSGLSTFALEDSIRRLIRRLTKGQRP